LGVVAVAVLKRRNVAEIGLTTNGFVLPETEAETPSGPLIRPGRFSKCAA